MKVNRAQFCSIFGCSRHEFDTYVAEGMPAQKAGAGRGAGWAVDTASAYRWLLDRDRRKARGHAVDGPASISDNPDFAAANAVDLNVERAKLAREQRVGHELRNAVSRGELIPADEVVEGWQAAIARARSLLLGMPPSAAEELVLEAAKGPAAVRERLAEFVHAALTELANTTLEDVGDEAA
jgi:phage terminase Nu1 subunit (DNA packaging protein)